nr:hypothetical protein [Acinetobacter sp. Marseille-Q1620]
MKTKLLLPFALTGLVSALTACGGESSHINENPYQGVVTSTNGCQASEGGNCQTFALDYPVAGLNFDCSSDTTNHFATAFDAGNIANGGCKVGDRIKFFIQGSQSSRTVNLGFVNLSKIRPEQVISGTKIRIAYLSLLDLATGLTDAEAKSMSMEDNTFKTLVGIIRVLQAVQVSNSNFQSDIQPITLTGALKDKLSTITSDIEAKDFLDGSYVEKLNPWLNISAIDEQAAQAVAKKLIYQANVATYSAGAANTSFLNTDIKGFMAKSQSQANSYSIAEMFLLTTRQGYTLGYATQWNGKPKLQTNDTLSDLASNLLIFQVSPKKFNLNTQDKWLDPLSYKTVKPLELQSPDKAENNISIYQGTLIADTAIPGTQDYYQRLINAKTTGDASIFGKWKQNIDGEQFNDGTVDIIKTDHATYLDKKIFKTKDNVAKGEKYIFPLYATLDVKFDTLTGATSSIAPTKLSIVIDENGDIRTNLATDGKLSSDQCPDIDPVTYKDSNGVQQYRIGTVGTTNTSADKREQSIYIRMLLSNPVFGNLDGVTAGIQPSQSTSLRLNLMNLLQDNVKGGIFILGYRTYKDQSTGQTLVTEVPSWTNPYAKFQHIYNTAKDNTPTPEMKDIALRQSGYFEGNVTLPACYQLKTKI